LADKPDDYGSDLIRGPFGTRVTLTVLRDGTEHTVSVKRAKIVTPVAASRMLSYRNARIGYLRLTRFSEGPGGELRAETQEVLRAGAGRSSSTCGGTAAA
jgi:C-terminal processing protease CtpA/Prc